MQLPDRRGRCRRAISFGHVDAQSLRPPGGCARARRPRTSSVAQATSGASKSRSADVSRHADAPPRRKASVRAAARAAISVESIRRGRGSGTAISALTRPGPEASTTTRSPRRTASRTLCVTNSTVRPCSDHRRSSSSCMASRVIASSAPNGSSIRTRSASWARTRASATRWRIPPDSSCGRCSSRPSRCTSGEQLADAVGPLGAGTPRRRSARSTLPPTVSHGMRVASWNISATRRGCDLDACRRWPW